MKSYSGSEFCFEMKFLLLLVVSVCLVSAFTQSEQDEALADADVSFIRFASSAVRPLFTANSLESFV